MGSIDGIDVDAAAAGVTGDGISVSPDDAGIFVNFGSLTLGGFTSAAASSELNLTGTFTYFFPIFFITKGLSGGSAGRSCRMWTFEPRCLSVGIEGAVAPVRAPDPNVCRCLFLASVKPSGPVVVVALAFWAAGCDLAGTIDLSLGAVVACPCGVDSVVEALGGSGA